MSCNSKKTIEADFSSVASVLTAIELATPLAYSYPDSLDLALTELNDPVVVVPSIRYGIDALNESITDHLYPAIVDTFLPPVKSDYPSLSTRVEQNVGRISYTELADFLEYASYPSVVDFNTRIVTNPRNVARDMNRYYEEQMSGSAISLCSLLSNPFESIAGLLDKIDSLTGNILNYLPSIASRLQSFAETMKAMTETLFESLRGILANVGGMAQQVIQGLANAPAAIAGIAQVFSNQFAALQNLLSEDNLANIKEGIDKFVTKAVLQFQKILENPQVILYLLYMFCKTQSFIESSLQTPIKSFQGMVSNASHEQNVLRVKSAPRTQAAIAAGRPTVTQESIAEIRAQKGNSHNAAVAAANPADVPDQTKVVWTPEHTTHPDPHSWSNLAFADSVINNSFWTTGGGKGMGISKAVGYYGCKLEVLEMLNKVGQMIGKKLTVNSAFRHPVYNRHVGGAKASMHMKGVALDVSMAGVDREAFCSAAYRVGFRGFGGYGSFIHVDTGSKRSWNKGRLPAGPWR
ncbi:peptidase M15 [Sinorhizobium phage phiN3]|uniref:Murein endopeptidase K n=1 Tax=Sinorhizobium phage phiN3 TaxID=1647405 RepID=A0A0F6WCM4_9CAUD|nr:peptidase [Sinorhizobium phage phiN3]AKF13376.1 peptidase M15 [Sinorhizobium phage phiN3]